MEVKFRHDPEVQTQQIDEGGQVIMCNRFSASLMNVSCISEHATRLGTNRHPHRTLNLLKQLSTRISFHDLLIRFAYNAITPASLMRKVMAPTKELYSMSPRRGVDGHFGIQVRVSNVTDNLSLW